MAIPEESAQDRIHRRAQQIVDRYPQLWQQAVAMTLQGFRDMGVDATSCPFGGWTLAFLNTAEQLLQQLPTTDP